MADGILPVDYALNQFKHELARMLPAHAADLVQDYLDEHGGVDFLAVDGEGWPEGCTVRVAIYPVNRGEDNDFEKDRGAVRNFRLRDLLIAKATEYDEEGDLSVRDAIAAIRSDLDAVEAALPIGKN